MRNLIAVVVAVPAFAFAQQQVVKPPVAEYWLSAETAVGTSVPGTSAATAGAMGGQAQGGRRLLLQLASQRPSADGPRADHFMPQGMTMGPSLPLVTQRQNPRADPVERDLPQGMKQPRGRLLIYWGCGDNVRLNQPVTVEFAMATQGQTPPKLVARRVSRPAAPSPTRARTFGDWSSQQDGKPVPAAASLKGDHRVVANYAPEMRFTLAAGHDFMDRVEIAASLRGNGAALAKWNAVATATGYFATVFGAESENQAVLWSSSSSQETGGMLMDYLPPAEVARLVREKVVMPAEQTECVVPAEVMKRVGGTAFLSFIAYGPEANFAQPPRPQDPRQPWEPLWAVKVRFKSTASTLLGQAADDERRPRRSPRQSREGRD